MSRRDFNQIALNKIFEELNHPARPSEMPRRIELCRLALTMVPREFNPGIWGMIQDDLASSLAENQMGNRSENLEQAINHYHQALEVRTRLADPERWARTYNNLGNAYRDRICGERAENIEQAIRHYQQALEVRTRQAFPKDWAQTQKNLASAFCKRIRGRRTENLEQAIRHAQKALEVYTLQRFPYFWAQTKNILGEIYRIRISGQRKKNIEQAIDHLKKALRVHTRQAFPEDWARIQNNLGNVYLIPVHGNQANDIEQAIDHFQQALEVRTRQADPEHWAQTQNNLGNAYGDRIRGDQTENIEQAIYHFEQALEVRTRQAFPEDWAQTRNNLGNAYLARIRGEPDKNNIERTEKNIEMAIKHFKQALEIRTRQALPEEWAQTQNNLGNAYLVRVRNGQAEINIEKAIDHFQRALEVRTLEEFPEDWAQTQRNLAVGYAERIRGELVDNVEKAIQHFQQTLKVYTYEAYPQEWAGTQNNLGISYDRLRDEQEENINRAIHHYQLALDIYTVEDFPDNCLKTARALGNLLFEVQRWELASKTYDKAFAAQDVLLEATFTRESKQAELAEAQNLPPRAAYAHVQAGKEKKAEGKQAANERAVEVLEHGRAQLLRESLERRRQDLEQLPNLGFKYLYENYMQARDEFDALQNKVTSKDVRSDDLIFQMDQALNKVHAATAAIREEAGQQYPQYKYFLRTRPYSEIQNQMETSSLVFLSSTSAGGLALVIGESSLQAVELPELKQDVLQKQIWSPTDEEVERINKHLKQGNITSEDIQAVKGGYFSMYALRSILVNNVSKELDAVLLETWKETLDHTTKWLWDAVMGELISILREHKSATIIPVGQLALLPLHAAWTKNDTTKPTQRRYVLDEVNISYAPSAYALWQANPGAKRTTEKLFAVENPDGSLVFSKDDVHAAIDVFMQSEHLSGDDAILEVVKEEMQKAHVLHFSTHGRAGWEKAEQARLTLANDEYLTLPDIYSLDLKNTRLAVLSACETGVPGLELIDEMIGLSAGMMQAGVPGVVGSLWSVNNGSTAMLMARFYQYWQKEGESPQDALSLAQIWLRDSLFESPYYWAAFTYTGV